MPEEFGNRPAVNASSAELVCPACASSCGHAETIPEYSREHPPKIEVHSHRSTVTPMSEKVTLFPIQRFSFLAGGKTYFFIIPPFVPRKPKPAEVIPISTTVSDEDEGAGEAARLNLPSALHGVMNS